MRMVLMALIVSVAAGPAVAAEPAQAGQVPPWEERVAPFLADRAKGDECLAVARATAGVAIELVNWGDAAHPRVEDLARDFSTDASVAVPAVIRSIPQDGEPKTLNMFCMFAGRSGGNVESVWFMD